LADLIKTVIIIGGYGQFGGRLARRLSKITDIKITDIKVLAAGPFGFMGCKNSG